MSVTPIKVYGTSFATCTQRTLLAAYENDLPIEILKVDLFKGEQKQPAHLARQPFGVIPALEHNNVKIYESRAIARYINDLAGDKNTLVPKDIAARALMEQWISLEANTFYEHIGAIIKVRYGNLFRGLPVDEAVLKNATEKLQFPLEVLDAHLAKNKFLAGDQYTLAEVFFQPYIAAVLKFDEKTVFESKPNVSRWLKEILDRPSWKKTLETKDKEQA